MKTPLQILSWVAIVMGVLAIFGAASEGGEDSLYALIGGTLYLSLGIVAITYIKEKG